jgi:hypothetical protein
VITPPGHLVFLGLNRYRIFVVTPARVLVLDAGKVSMKKARGVVAELPRSTRLGPGSGLWHVIPVGEEKLRVHRRFFKDLETAGQEANAACPAWAGPASSCQSPARRRLRGGRR